MNAPSTLFLVDDHPMMRRGLRQILELEDDLQVIGEASNGGEVLALLAERQPDLILLDNNMPQMSGVEVLKQIRQQGYRGKVLLFTVSDAEEDVRDALRFGADGYLLKDMEPEQLLEQLRAVLRGQMAVSPALTSVLAQALRTPASASRADLTDRERQVLRMLATGQSNKMIGRKLGITEGTVKVHVKNLLHKLGLRTRVEAAVWVMENERARG
ncbi:MAG: two-component system response regulator NarL [Thiohalobacteraceae bacterium]